MSQYPDQPGSMTIEQYHADTDRVSHSMLDTYIESPELYQKKYVLKTLPVERKKDHFSVGSALHCLILEPDLFETKYVVLTEKLNRRTKAGKEAAAELAIEYADKEIITLADYDLLRQIEKSVRRNTMARDLVVPGLVGGENEKVFWAQHDEYPEIDLRCRTDRLITGGDIIVDLKSSRDPSPDGFARSLAEFGYHRQDTFYRDVVRWATGRDCQTYFVVVGKQEPFDCFVYQLGDADLRIGHEENIAAFNRLSYSMQYDYYRSPYADAVNTVHLPRWYKKDTST